MRNVSFAEYLFIYLLHHLYLYSKTIQRNFRQAVCNPKKKIKLRTVELHLDKAILLGLADSFKSLTNKNKINTSRAIKPIKNQNKGKGIK